MNPSFSPDPRQRVILEHARGPLIVTGGAGTGKTTALRERLATLIEAAADPERVALVVGSRRARDQASAFLLGRLQGSLPTLHVLTIHGLAFHVLAERFARLGYAEPPSVLSAADQFGKVRELLADQDPDAWPAYGHLLQMRAFADEVRQFLSRAQESLWTPEDIEERATASGLTGWLELARFYREYQEIADDLSVVDFAGLVQRAARVAGEGPSLFDHLMVDDYQDVTLAAEALIAGLGAGSIVGAGDPDAHVFSFQGATDVPIKRFDRTFPGAASLELIVTHRTGTEPVEPEAWQAAHTSEEHAAIARELRRLHVEDDVPWGLLAVIVRRQGAHLGGLLRALDDARVPRAVPERGLSLGAEPATFPYVLALRWIAATQPTERADLIESVLTSELVRLSPAVARGLMRVAQATAGSAAEALEQTGGLSGEEAEDVAEVRSVLARAREVADRSVLDAFAILWRDLPSSRRLVAQAEHDEVARRELDAVVAFASAVTDAGEGGDPSTAAFLASLDGGGHGPGAGTWEKVRPDAVQVLTAHGAVGQEFDSVLVAGAVEGNFPSLSRAEPMFDLSALDRPLSQADRNRARLEDERRLFRMVLGRARRRVVLLASDPHSEREPAARSRFVDELKLHWVPAPERPFREPVSVREAAALWRRTLADPAAENYERLAAIDGLVALGVDPSRWWFQRQWSDTGRPLHETFHLSYSKLSTLENCELQHVLRNELGLGRPGGYHAWVGKTVHKLIEEVEKGELEKSPTAMTAALDARWRHQEFPSRAVSEAFRYLAKTKMLRNWFDNYAATPATAIEQYFEFAFDEVTVIGYIDRIGSAVDGTAITDFKSGNADRAPKAEDSLQLGIYYLAVQEAEDLQRYQPVKMVELTYLKGNWRDGRIEHRKWVVTPGEEEAYATRVRERLSELIARTKELNQHDVYMPNPYADCHFCEYKTLCPLFPEGRHLFPVDQVANR
ncbi:MAG: ATP-dependent DNA helicase [Actinomycetota bacterium]